VPTEMVAEACHVGRRRRGTADPGCHWSSCSRHCGSPKSPQRSTLSSSTDGRTGWSVCLPSTETLMRCASLAFPHTQPPRPANRSRYGSGDRRARRLR
jgi:hypothetical protein